MRGKTIILRLFAFQFYVRPRQDQTLNGVFNENYDYLKDLELSEDYKDATDISVELLIGLDFYYNFVTDKVC